MADNSVVVDISASAFSVEAVKRAAYALMGQYDIAIDPGADTIRCTIRHASANGSLDTAQRDLRREVVDHDLRISIEQRTSPYRDMILGLAFSKTGLQDG